jgi:hypothetical protein
VPPSSSNNDFIADSSVCSDFLQYTVSTISTTFF